VGGTFEKGLMPVWWPCGFVRATVRACVPPPLAHAHPGFPCRGAVCLLQRDVLARVGEDGEWTNSFNGIPLDATMSPSSPTQRVFKVSLGLSPPSHTRPFPTCCRSPRSRACLGP
jgi:hypothetical protein